MNIDAANISDLISKTIQWLKSSKYGVLYGYSRDGGSLSVRVEKMKIENREHLVVKLMHITVPEPERQNRIYSNFISDIDMLKKFDVRWHDTVHNSFLVRRHRKYRCTECEGSFYRIIGSSSGDSG